FFKKKYVTAFPNEVVLELTNHCNLKCITCPHPIMTRSKGFISLELVRKVLGELKGKVGLIDLDMFGESQLHPAFFDIVSLIRESGQKSLYNTNLSWQSEEDLQRLALEGPDIIVISMDGATKKTYEKIRVGAKWEQLVNNIEILTSFKTSSHLVVQMVVSRLNFDEIKKFKKFCKGRNIEFRLHPYEVLIPNKTELTLPIGKSTRGHCIMPWRKLVIGWDGIIVPCCADYDKIHPLGDAKQSSLQQIWNGEDFQSFRQLHILGEKKARENKLCHSCEWFSPSTPLLVGSIFVSAYRAKRILHFLENLSVRFSTILFKKKPDV
ncbi:MAG: radical SAM protein, partial [Halobacteriovoraceae bacterium]|nr:radical SAM protein [Halobacteriovoraceae bacterium]